MHLVLYQTIRILTIIQNIKIIVIVVMIINLVFLEANLIVELAYLCVIVDII